MMVKKLSLLLLALTAFNTASATDTPQTMTEHLDDDRLIDKRHLEQTWHTSKPETQISKPSHGNYQRTNDKLEMSKQTLAKHPELIARALLQAVIQGNAENVKLLLPIYESTPNQSNDVLLTQWALAILARHNQDHTQAIKRYRQLIAAKPDIPPANLQLAITLFENNELQAAQAQFHKLRADVLPYEMQVLIERYLQAIAYKDRWTVDGGLTYLNDPNINNAPKVNIIEQQAGVLRAEPKQSAEGMGMNASIGKRWSWGNGYFNTANLSGNAKYYWDNQKYNEASAHVRLGIGYQNSKMQVITTPFIEQTLYAGGSTDSQTLRRFSKSSGVSFDVNYWLTPKWQLSGSYEYTDQRYHTRKHLNGHSHFASTELIHYPNAQRQLYANLNYNQTNARDADDSFVRRGATVGWRQEWNKGLSTNLSASFAKKQHQGPTALFGVIHRNEYGLQASVWHRAWHYKGITPRLTYQYHKNKSNHPFYSFDKQRVYISFTKQF